MSRDNSHININPLTILRARFAPDDGTDGGTPVRSQIPESRGVNNRNSREDNSDENENNNDNNNDIFSKMWEDDDDNSDRNPGDGHDAGDTQNQSPEDWWQNHVKSLDLGARVDARELSEQMQNGDFSGLEALLANSAQSAYRASLNAANKLIERRVSSAVEEAVNKATGLTKADAAVSAMNRKFPFTKDPAIAPVANGILNQMLKKTGGDLDTALDKIGQYYRRMSKLSADDIRDPAEQTRYGNGRRNYPGPDNRVSPRGGNEQSNAAFDSKFWGELLGGEK